MTLPFFCQIAWNASKSNQVLSWAADLGGFSPSLVHSHSSGLVHLGFWLVPWIFSFFLALKILPFANLNLVPTLCSFKIWQVSRSGVLLYVCFRLPPPPMGLYLQCSARQLNVSLPFLLSLSSLWYHSRTRHMSRVLSYEHVLYIFQYFSQFYTTANSSTDFSFGLSSISVWVKIYLCISILPMCICIDIYHLYPIFVHFCSWL